MNRRKLLIATTATLLTRNALAQSNTQGIDYAASTRAIETDQELQYLAQAMETLIFVMTTAILGEPNTLLESEQAFSPFRTVLIAPDARVAINDHLRSDGEHVKIAFDGIAVAGSSLSELLSGFSGPSGERLRSSLVSAFVRVSVVLMVSPAKAEGWWCEIYGLRKIVCPTHR